MSETKLREAALVIVEGLTSPCISSNQFNSLVAAGGGDVYAVLLCVAQAAQRLARRVPISKFPVGAAVLSADGAVFFGTNSEVEGSLTTAIHAEQSAIHAAFVNGCTAIKALAASYPPCGYCRQFMNEMTKAQEELQIVIPDETAARPYLIHQLSFLLPLSYSPAHLGNAFGMLSMPPWTPSSPELKDPIISKPLLQALCCSYAPYTRVPAAVQLNFAHAAPALGVYMENVAYNPSVSPFFAALNYANLCGRDPREIREVLLVQRQKDPRDIDQREMNFSNEIRSILACHPLFSGAAFKCIEVPLTRVNL